MHKVLTLIFIFFLCYTTQAQFGPVFFIDTLTNENIQQLACADFNNDGQQDILSANLHWPNDLMKLYIQSGNQTFTVQSIPEADSLTNLESFAVADIYRDGWTDFVIASEFPYRIVLYENDHGTFIPHIIDDSLDLTPQVLLEDFNHDGLIDILSLQHIEIVLYLALDEGVFSPPQVIHSGTEFYAIDAADYNGDGYHDVSVASDGFEILLNDSTGHFFIQSQQGLGLDFALQSGDLDGDTDVDIVVYRSLSGLLFYTNDGGGNFEFQDTILASTDIFISYSLEDLNCDSSLDLFTSIPQPGKMILIENDGMGNFSAPVLLHQQPGELVSAVTTGDLNDDQVTDVVWGHLTLGAQINECTSVAVDESIILDNMLNVFPNPVQNYFVIENNSQMNLFTSLYDQRGYVVLSAIAMEASSTKTIDLPYPGLYFLMAHDHAGRLVFNRKIVVQHR